MDDKQTILNAIATLSTTVATLNGVGKTEAIDKVVDKILELVDKL